MRVTHLAAEGVHGYLPLEVTFDPNLTFLTGLNGSGKTSALKLLMGLLTPDLEELSTIAFKSAEVTIRDGDVEIVVRSTKNESGIELSMSSVKDALFVSNEQLQALRSDKDTQAIAYKPIGQHAIIQAISGIPTPMFLGLDRRFHYRDVALRGKQQRQFELSLVEVVRQLSGSNISLEEKRPDAGLADVNILYRERMTEVRTQQEELDKRLRDRLLLGAFRYKPFDTNESSLQPTRKVLEKYRKRIAEVAKAAGGLSVPVSEVHSTLESFFEHATRILDELDKATEAAAELSPKRSPGTRTRNKTRTKTQGRSARPQIIDLSSPIFKVFSDWLINQPLIDRVLEHLEQLDLYNADRAKLHEPIERFLGLVNKFLVQTGKRVVATERDSLEVILHSDLSTRPLWALSSGERQIVVMLAHLSLNKALSGSRVFIIDEPELSLHIGWQEMLVESIHEANPNVQLIMATHSPAIILDREDNCRTLTPVARG